MKVSLYKKLLVVLALVGLLASPLQFASAQQNSGSGLSISPTRTELSIKPGQAGTVTITIKNVTQGAITAKALVNDFEPDNDTGEPRLLTDDNKRSAASIRDFLIGFDDIELAPDEEKEINIPIQIPSDAAPGAYYGVIRYQAVPKSSGEQGAGQVALTASVGSLVLIEVPGNITEKIQVMSVKAYLGDKSGTFFTNKPNQVGIKVKNLGNSFAKPFGQVQIKDMTGKQVHAYEINNSTPRGNILPNSERTFKDELKGISKPGRYTVTANVSFGRGGEILNYTASFWYMPTWMIIVVLVVLLALIGAAMYLFKRYNSRAVSRRSKK